MIPLPPWLTVKAVIGLAFAACFFLIGMGVHKTFSDRTLARKERDWARERADAAQKLADEEQKSRKRESEWIKHTAEKEREYAATLKKRDAVIRDQRAVASGLHDAIERARAHAAATATASPACRDVSQRVETLGVLLGERNRMATESEREADDLRDELALCRGYVEVIYKD